MATAAKKVYPYVSLDLKGNQRYVGINQWEGKDNVDLTSQCIVIYLPPVEIEVTLPTEDQMRLGAAALIDGTMLEARAKFHAQQTLMQSIKNDLLRLEHADVLDAEPMRGRPVDADGTLDDDIPV